MQSKQNTPLGSSSNLALTQEPAIMSTSMEQKSENTPKADEESCPVCQEKLSNQKMVFQCGHMICCKCECWFLHQCSSFESPAYVFYDLH